VGLAVPSCSNGIPTGPFTVTMSDRGSVRDLWYAAHEAGNGVDPAWTGSIDGCERGTVSRAFRDATLARINYFRAMAGVPSGVTFTKVDNARAQAAALIMSAQGELSHTPPSTWACWSEDGRIGAGFSNLSSGAIGPDAIDQTMEDGGAGNELVGRRRKLLIPRVREMGTGSVPATGAHPAVQAVLPGARSDAVRPRDGFVAWPPRGYVPYQVVFPRWSFQLGDADFTSATVTMRRPGDRPLALTIVDRTTFFGPGLVWVTDDVPDGAGWSAPPTDDPITVTVGNVLVGGRARSFTYTTTIFEP
jgi:hypothetical protein